MRKSAPPTQNCPQAKTGSIRSRRSSPGLSVLSIQEDTRGILRAGRGCRCLDRLGRTRRCRLATQNPGPTHKGKGYFSLRPKLIFQHVRRKMRFQITEYQPHKETRSPISSVPCPAWRNQKYPPPLRNTLLQRSASGARKGLCQPEPPQAKTGQIRIRRSRPGRPSCPLNSRGCSRHHFAGQLPVLGSTGSQ